MTRRHARAIAACCALAKLVRAGIFAPNTPCPDGSKMTDTMWDFKSQSNLQGDFALSTYTGTGTVSEADLMSCCVSFSNGALIISPKAAGVHSLETAEITAATKDLWHLPIWVAVEGMHDQPGQQIDPRSMWGVRYAHHSLQVVQFVDGDSYAAEWVSVQHSTQTDNKENFWVAVSGGTDQGSWKPATIYGKGSWTPQNSLVRDTTRKYSYDSLLFTDGASHYQWTAYQLWTADGLSVGYLNPNSQSSGSNITVNYKASDITDGKITGSTKGSVRAHRSHSPNRSSKSGAQRLFFEAQFANAPPDTGTVQATAWAITRIQVSGCLVGGDGTTQSAIAQPAPPPSSSSSAQPSTSSASSIIISNSLSNSSAPPSSSAPSSSSPAGGGGLGPIVVTQIYSTAPAGAPPGAVIQKIQTLTLSATSPLSASASWSKAVVLLAALNIAHFLFAIACG